jgi:oxygen-independent coproporphyrinogen-3 oxidase
MEANPRTVTASKAMLMRELGVTRVSLGIQAWDDATLKTLGRDHAPAEAEETWQALKEAKFPSLNLDLMFSIPGQSLETWRETLERSLSLKPDHISAYNLNYEEDTDFFRRLRAGEFREDEGRDAEFFHLGIDLLEGGGFEHYEISNYAKPGHRSGSQRGLLAWRGLYRHRTRRVFDGGWQALAQREGHAALHGDDAGWRKHSGGSRGTHAGAAAHGALRTGTAHRPRPAAGIDHP